MAEDLGRCGGGLRTQPAQRQRRGLPAQPLPHRRGEVTGQQGLRADQQARRAQGVQEGTRVDVGHAVPGGVGSYGSLGMSAVEQVEQLGDGGVGQLQDHGVGGVHAKLEQVRRTPQAAQAGQQGRPLKGRALWVERCWVGRDTAGRDVDWSMARQRVTGRGGPSFVIHSDPSPCRAVSTGKTRVIHSSRRRVSPSRHNTLCLNSDWHPDRAPGRGEQWAAPPVATRVMLIEAQD